MERLVVFLQLIALSGAFTTLPPPGFGHTESSMFWGQNGMGTFTQSPFFPEYNTHNAQQQVVGNHQASLEELVRLTMQAQINAAKQNTSAAATAKQNLNTQTPFGLPWLTGSSIPGANNQAAGGMDPNAHINMLHLKHVMVGNSQPNTNGLPQGNIGPQQGLASLYQAYIQQMNLQTTTSSTTTTTPAPTPSPTISSYTAPPFKYGPAEGKTPSPTKTLAEIILERMNQLERKNSSSPTKTKGCYYKNHWYSPLTEITKGQTGDWCYGTYCNHEGVVVHWDDHKCTQAIQTTPTFTQPTTTPATNGALGCFRNGRWYDPGQDITNNRNMETGACYGSYCDYTSKVINWEDKCYATVAPDSAMGGMGSMAGMSGMGSMAGMGGMGSMAGMGGMGSMAGMSGGLASMEGMSGMAALAAMSGNGMAGMEGGMGGMAGMGGGMGGMGGMGGGMGGMGMMGGSAAAAEALGLKR